MRPIPKNQLDPKIKNVWRISDAISLTVVYVCCAIGFFIAALVAPEEAAWAWIVVGVMTAIWVVCLITVRARAEHRYQAGSHPARFQPGECDCGHGRGRA